MKTTLDCIPCLARQAVAATRLAAADPNCRAQIMGEVLHWMADMDLNQPPPALSQITNRIIRERSGNQDPYRLAKEEHNQLVLRMLPELREMIAQSPDQLLLAVRLAIAGNVIDLGTSSEIAEGNVRAEIEQALAEPFVGDAESFRQAAAEARRILYIADNAGEIAFDRLLIEQLGAERVTLVVRGGPIINDATRSDAEMVGLQHVVEIIDNGTDAPGTMLADCGPELRQRFGAADLIIAKGQGNFETLWEEQGNIYLLFKVKCPVIAEKVGLPLGTQVLLRNGTGLPEQDFGPAAGIDG